MSTPATPEYPFTRFLEDRDLIENILEFHPHTAEAIGSENLSTLQSFYHLGDTEADAYEAFIKTSDGPSFNRARQSLNRLRREVGMPAIDD